MDWSGTDDHFLYHIFGFWIVCWWHGDFWGQPQSSRHQSCVFGGVRGGGGDFAARRWSQSSSGRVDLCRLAPKSLLIFGCLGFVKVLRQKSLRRWRPKGMPWSIIWSMRNQTQSSLLCITICWKSHVPWLIKRLDHRVSYFGKTEKVPEILISPLTICITLPL